MPDSVLGRRPWVQRLSTIVYVVPATGPNLVLVVQVSDMTSASPLWTVSLMDGWKPNKNPLDCGMPLSLPNRLSLMSRTIQSQWDATETQRWVPRGCLQVPGIPACWPVTLLTVWVTCRAFPTVCREFDHSSEIYYHSQNASLWWICPPSIMRTSSQGGKWCYLPCARHKRVTNYTLRSHHGVIRITHNRSCCSFSRIGGNI